jgi:hypothetical protein
MSARVGKGICRQPAYTVSGTLRSVAFVIMTRACARESLGHGNIDITTCDRLVEI